MPRTIIVAMTAVAVFATVAVANTKIVKDSVGETERLENKPRLDIKKAKVGHTGDGRLLHTVTMNAKLKPAKTRERPLILINTRGNQQSSPEFVVLGQRVLKLKEDGNEKVGAASIGNSRKTWKYRFKPKSIGNPKEYGWAALTSKGKTSDVVPNRRYKKHRP